MLCSGYICDRQEEDRKGNYMRAIKHDWEPRCNEWVSVNVSRAHICSARICPMRIVMHRKWTQVRTMLLAICQSTIMSD